MFAGKRIAHNKWTYYLIIFLLIIIISVICIRCNVKNNPNIYENKIDSLQKEIDSINSLKDSVDQKIDTITLLIEKTRIQYEKDRDIILSNTTSEDYEFFTEYIRSNQERLDSISNI